MENFKSANIRIMSKEKTYVHENTKNTTFLAMWKRIIKEEDYLDLVVLCVPSTSREVGFFSIARGPNSRLDYCWLGLGGLASIQSQGRREIPATTTARHHCEGNDELLSSLSLC